jgi:hypothetical protein
MVVASGSAALVCDAPAWILPFRSVFFRLNRCDLATAVIRIIVVILGAIFAIAGAVPLALNMEISSRICLSL